MTLTNLVAEATYLQVRYSEAKYLIFDNTHAFFISAFECMTFHFKSMKSVLGVCVVKIRKRSCKRGDTRTTNPRFVSSCKYYLKKSMPVPMMMLLPSVPLYGQIDRRRR